MVQNMNTSTIDLNNDFNKIRNWAIQWKMSSTSSLSKAILNFQEDLNNLLSQVNKTIGLLRKLQAILQ